MAMKATISTYNRYSGRLEPEQICGGLLIRFAYGNLLGRIFQSTVGSGIIFSRMASLIANRRFSALFIESFVRRHGISVADCGKDLRSYDTFQEFFTRKLKPAARPIDGDRDSICAPVDGRYLHIAKLPQAGTVAVKGRRLKLEELLGSVSLARKFVGGSAFIARLAPFDYHRFHFPCDGVPNRSLRLGHRLHGVHQLALERVRALCTNRRFLTRIVSDSGEVAMVEVGATFVGSVKQCYVPGVHAKKGDEKGFFALGGSTVVLLFEPGAAVAANDIRHWSGRDVETYVKMGDCIAARS
ncbi:MAG: archaetidylserine decarboxylase [Puniceicoccales bacterium]|jgi:phosphatidylserine decarboxylase|nr:archaetidylserine decarboxylase [Puniceicoccales bacterium]